MAADPMPPGWVAVAAWHQPSPPPPQAAIDVETDTGAAFRQLSEAYQVLADAKQRRLYDVQYRRAVDNKGGGASQGSVFTVVRACLLARARARGRAGRGVRACVSA